MEKLHVKHRRDWKRFSHNVIVKNDHDGNRFMTIPIHSLKRFVCASLTCTCESICSNVQSLGLFLGKISINLLVVDVFLRAACCICVTWGRKSAQDSFIKCGAASEEAVNQFYLFYIGGQLSWHPRTQTPQEWTGWIFLLQLCCCRLVVKGDLLSYWFDIPDLKKMIAIALVIGK